MAAIVKNEDELGKEIKKGTTEIEIPLGPFSDKVLKIKHTGEAAWAIAIVAIAAAVVIAVGSGGVGIPIAAAGAVPAIGVLGVPAVTTSIGIAVAGGGVGALNKLREYNIEKKSDKIILRKK